MQNNFLSQLYFDLSLFTYRSIFDDIDNVWEALPKINPFITSLFEKGIVKNNYEGRKDVYIGEGTVIQPDVYFNGPVIIGKNCNIGHASLFREGCIIGDDSHIGHAVEVKHSIILNNSNAAHLNYIGDSIVGNDVNISGGTIIANYRLDKKPVTIKYKDERIETKLLKFGSIIGDNSNIGVNAVLNPGTLLGKSSIVFPLTSVGGIHEESEIIK